METTPFTFMILLFISSLFTTHAQISVSGNGNVTEKERDVQPFNSVSTSNGWDIILTQGDEYKLVIEADENLIEYVITEVNNEELSVYSKVNISNGQVRRVYITCKELNKINASGGSDVSSQTSFLQ